METEDLLREFKRAVSMLSEYMAADYYASQDDYNELEHFENIIEKLENTNHLTN